MSGYIGNFSFGRRAVRKATYDQAVSEFPRLILRISQGNIIVYPQYAIGQGDIYVCSSNFRSIFFKRERWVIVKEDLELCKEVSKNVNTFIIGGEESRSIEKIRDLLKSKIEDRKPKTSDNGNVKHDEC